MRTAVVAGTPRSGTKMVGSILAALGVGAADEYCDPRVSGQLIDEWGISPDSYPRELRERRSVGGWFITQAHVEHDLAVALDGPPDLWVWVRRRDLVAQAVSWDLATQTGDWFGQPTTAGSYRPGHITDLIDKITAHNAAWADRLAGRPVWAVWYEDLPAELATTCRQATDLNRRFADRYRRGHP